MFLSTLRIACWTVLTLGLPLASAHSQLAQKVVECDTENRRSVDQQIQACTSAIQSGGLTEEQLARAYKRRGRAYLYFRSDYDLAIRDLTEAIRLNPRDALAFYSRGDAYKVKAAKRSGEETQQLATRALSDFDENIRLKARLEPLDYINRSNAFVLLALPERAIVDLDEALRIDPPDEHRALVNRCAANLMLDRLPEALADCNEAVRRQIYDYPLSVRALVHLRMSEYALSIRDANAALQCETGPYHKAVALYARGVAKREDGDKSGGNADVAAATQLLPSVAIEVRRYGVW